MSGRSVAPSFLAQQPTSGDWRLIGRHCDGCGENLFGRVDAVCPRCGVTALADIVLPDDGVVRTFTVLRNPPPGQRRSTAPTPPYAVGLVELDGVRLQVMSQLDLPLDRVAVEMPVRLRIRELFVDNGEPVVGFAFAEYSA